MSITFVCFWNWPSANFAASPWASRNVLQLHMDLLAATWRTSVSYVGKSILASALPNIPTWQLLEYSGAKVGASRSGPRLQQLVSHYVSGSLNWKPRKCYQIVFKSMPNKEPIISAVVHVQMKLLPLDLTRTVNIFQKFATWFLDTACPTKLPEGFLEARWSTHGRWMQMDADGTPCIACCGQSRRLLGGFRRNWA